MRSRRPVYPHKLDINLVLHALKLIPIDQPLITVWRNSFAGNPNLRVKSTTKEIPWSVDIYPRNYYFVHVDLRFTQVCRSIPSLIGYLRKMLSV
jgi:hypothetical protein